MAATAPNPAPKRRSRGIYLLPNLFTTAALFAGFYAIIAATNARFEAAAISIFFAMVLDGLDGRVARLTNTQSEFGVQYDSLSDMVSFGLAPALVAYQWALSGLGRLGWFAAFIYTAAAALRLARFNTRTGESDRRYFQGLSSPAAAAVIAGMIWVADGYAIDGATLKIPAVVITVLVGLLMVSNLLYRSFKDLDLKGRVPFVVTVGVMLAFAVVLIDPAVVLFSLFSAYALSGPFVALHQRWRKRERPADVSEPPAAGDDSS